MALLLHEKNFVLNNLLNISFDTEIQGPIFLLKYLYLSTPPPPPPHTHTKQRTLQQAMSRQAEQ